MKDKQKRSKGSYIDEYSKIINGVKVQIKETIVVGRDHKIMNFSRKFNPGIPYKRS